MKNLSVGENLRKIRKSKNITIQDVAKKTGLTSSFISQFERNLTDGSVASLQKIASALGVTVSELFQYENEFTSTMDEISIVRNDYRKKLKYPGGKLTDYQLTNDKGQLQVLLCEVKKGGTSGEQYHHAGVEECIIVLEGQMEITIDRSTYILNEGDTIKFASHKPHAWRNLGDDCLKVIWIITPPSY
ncbi:MAG: cupin domain-containing protein [Solibacillus sp.]